MKVSFILLAHEAPEQLKSLLEPLLLAGSNVYVHHDASSQGNLQQSVTQWGFDSLPGKIYYAKRVKVVWGEWSIVQATLNCLEQIRQHDIDSDYFMLISGSCMPVKPIPLLEKYLAESGKDHIEAVNAEKNTWVTAGLQKQRWSKFHLFNWRYQHFLFENSLQLQRKLKIKRVIPLNHTAHMGSQWWCLRRSTLLQIMDLVDKKPILRSFYKRTWVPDELFFQTLVANLVPTSDINGELLTRYKFNSWGIPRVYYNDDYPELLAEKRFFVRKVSHRATELRERLAAIAPMTVPDFSELLKTSEPERQQLIEHVNMQAHIEANRWHSLESHHENVYDYIKSIPNPMMVLVGEDTPAKRQALAVLDQLEDTVVYGNLFDPIQVSAGYEPSGYLGVGRDAAKLTQHTWHQVLGDIAYQEAGKTLVFSLGKNALRYLEVLRWNTRLSVILLDQDKPENLSKPLLQDLYLKSKVLHQLQDRHCKFLRVPVKAVIDAVHLTQCNARDTDYVSWALHKYYQKIRWPNLLSNDAHLEQLKSIKEKIVIFIIPSERLLSIFTSQLQKKLDVIINTNIFSIIPKNDQTLDWHYYLADVMHLNKIKNNSNIIYTTMLAQNIAYLDTLRWKRDLFVVELQTLNEKNHTNGLILNPDGGTINGEHLFHQTTLTNDTNKLKTLMGGRNCQFITMPYDNIDLLEEVIQDFSETISSDISTGKLISVLNV